MTPEFIKHESGTPTAREREYFQFLSDVSRINGIENLDGTQWVDGYSLDWLHDMFCDGASAPEAAAQIPDFSA